VVVRQVEGEEAMFATILILFLSARRVFPKEECLKGL
jgi:hypothetical protein